MTPDTDIPVLPREETVWDPESALERAAREVDTETLERRGIRRVRVLSQSEFARLLDELASRSARTANFCEGESAPAEPGPRPSRAPRLEPRVASRRAALLCDMFREELAPLVRPS
ncbi:MAG: hypothetical protein ACUVYA_07410 [Planctomycetota bacterium]